VVVSFFAVVRFGLHACLPGAMCHGTNLASIWRNHNEIRYKKIRKEQRVKNMDFVAAKILI